MKAKFTLLVALMLTSLFQVWAQRAVKTSDLEAHLYDHDTLVYASDSSIYKVENLGENVNSDHVESGPRISPDGKTLYFFRIDTTINTKRAQEYTSQIYSSEYNEKDSTWSKAEDIGKPLNSKGASSVQSVIKDGEVLILTNHYLKNGLTKNGISMSSKKGKRWTFPEDIKIPHFHNDARYSVHVQNDGKTMILAVHNDHDKLALGQQDLYVCFLKPDGKHWTDPINLGPKINTPKSEGTAFLTSDSKTMYFSSNGHRGSLGGYDIYRTERLDSSWTNWSKPVNMGAPFNTKDNEFYFSVPDKGDYAYLSHHFKTSDKLEHSDIVRIKLIAAPKPKLLVLEGFSFDKFTKNKINATIIFRDSKGNIVKSPTEKEGTNITDTTYSTVSKGYYKELPLGEKYTYEVVAEGYKTIKGDLDAKKYGKYTEKKLDFYLELDPLLMLTMKFVDEDSGEPIDSVNVKVKQMPNKAFGEGTTGLTNEYYTELPGGHEYEFEFQAHGYLFKIDKRDLTNFTERKKEVMVVKMKKLVGLTFQVENIEFDVNKATLRPSSFPPLDTLVRIMKHIPEIIVEIQGHTDSDGSNAANKSLSQRRAQSVVNYLVQHGISKKQFVAKGYGEETPLVPNNSKANKQRNRRVMFKVLKVLGDHVKVEGHN